MVNYTAKTCVKWQLSIKTKNGFQVKLSLNAGQKYCRMLQREHSAILLTFIKLSVVIKTFVLSNFEWPFYTDFTVHHDWPISDGVLSVDCSQVRSISVVPRARHCMIPAILPSMSLKNAPSAGLRACPKKIR